MGPWRQEENAEPGDNHCGQGQHDDVLRADLVVHPPGTSPGLRTVFAAIAEDHDIAGAAERRLGQTAAEREDAPARLSRKMAGRR